jgi:transposase
MNKTSKYSLEFRERAVRLVLEQQDKHDSQWAALVAVTGKVGCTAETLRKWMKRAEPRDGKDGALTVSERDRLKALERERQAHDFRPAQTFGMGVFRQLWAAGFVRLPSLQNTGKARARSGYRAVERRCTRACRPRCVRVHR